MAVIEQRVQVGCCGAANHHTSGHGVERAACPAEFGCRQQLGATEPAVADGDPHWLGYRASTVTDSPSPHGRVPAYSKKSFRYFDAEKQSHIRVFQSQPFFHRVVQFGQARWVGIMCDIRRLH